MQYISTERGAFNNCIVFVMDKIITYNYHKNVSLAEIAISDISPRCYGVAE